ncbi:MAG: hypothetical protein J6Y78_02380 [Paludibacteraceae bacterium]|nr:hypothetical protein [Paludibacteraceae bacterium]
MNEKKKQPGFLSQLLLGFLVTKAAGSVIHYFKENKRKRDQEWHDTVFWQEAIRRKESEDFNDDIKDDYDDYDWI